MLPYKYAELDVKLHKEKNRPIKPERPFGLEQVFQIFRYFFLTVRTEKNKEVLNSTYIRVFLCLFIDYSVTTGSISMNLFLNERV